MRGSSGSDPLQDALIALAALGGERDRAAAGALRGRLQERRLRVLVAGEAKRGKSTLVNALLGRAVLPMGVTPLTAVATAVRHGPDEGVSARFTDGRTELLPVTALEELVTERGNPGNGRRVASVTVSVDAPVLAQGAELVDTPGTGSVYAHNTAEAEAALGTMDAAVFVLTADPPASASERELMTRVAGGSVRMFVVLNKADYLARDELEEALDFAARVAGEAAGSPVRVYPLSARAALTGGQDGDSGFAAFREDFTAYLDQGCSPDLRRSVTAHARRLAGALRDEVDLARRAAELRTGDAAARVDAFGARLAAVAAGRRDAADLVRAESARMLTALNESARRAERDGIQAVTAGLDRLLEGELAAAGAAGIERAGRARLGELAVATAEAWRQDQAARMEDGLARLDERMTAGLLAELAAVRDAAAGLLGLSLTVPDAGGRLAPDLRFFYLVAEQAGQTELLAGVLRRHLPGEAGRRRARAWLHREVADLVPRQIGRARADLQYRLAGATRALVRAVEARYAESTGRLDGALRTAATVSRATAGEAAAHGQRLARRRQALDEVHRLLDEATGRMPR